MGYESDTVEVWGKPAPPVQILSHTLRDEDTWLPHCDDLFVHIIAPPCEHAPTLDQLGSVGQHSI